MKIDFSNVRTFDWGELYYIELETEIGIDAFRTLNSNQEDSLRSTKQKFEDILKNDTTLNGLEPEYQGSYYTQMFEREEMTIQELQRQQRYSMCLSVFSFFEGRLKSICSQIEKEFDFKLKVADLNGNDDLMRYWNYLEKVFEVDTQKATPYFTPIKQQKVVRNIIAHQDGLLNADKKKGITLVEGLSLKQLGSDFQIEITDTSYVLYLLDKMEVLFKELLIAINKRYNEKKNVA